ncbi:MAG TPA: 2-enoyl thioester reductase domain-containing protein [Chthoniobacterales bacterium]
MSRIATAAIFHQHGTPADVIQLEQQPVREPEPGEILVRMLWSPVNPADLNVLEGTYGRLPKLPATPGMEGVGEVSTVGAEVTRFSPGDLVFIPSGAGYWREFWTGNPDDCVRVSAEMPADVAATLRINPATAWRMLHDFVSLQPGEWILQNAANSAVGRCVIEIAHYFGWKTVNLVRREELIPELEALGADAVILDDADAKDKVRDAMGGAKARLALNAVGGDSAYRQISALGNGGQLVTYGAMSRKPVRVSNGALIFKNVAIRGFWITTWYVSATRDEKEEFFRQLGVLASQGLLRTPVDSRFPLSQIKEAIARAEQSGRNGKVLLDLSPVPNPAS